VILGREDMARGQQGGVPWNARGEVEQDMTQLVRHQGQQKRAGIRVDEKWGWRGKKPGPDIALRLGAGDSQGSSWLSRGKFDDFHNTVLLG
jgi:hypothetical protein